MQATPIVQDKKNTLYFFPKKWETTTPKKLNQVMDAISAKISSVTTQSPQIDHVQWAQKHQLCLLLKQTKNELLKVHPFTNNEKKTIYSHLLSQKSVVKNFFDSCQLNSGSLPLLLQVFHEINGVLLRAKRFSPISESNKDSFIEIPLPSLETLADGRCFLRALFSYDDDQARSCSVDQLFKIKLKTKKGKISVQKLCEDIVLSLTNICNTTEEDLKYISFFLKDQSSTCKWNLEIMDAFIQLALHTISDLTDDTPVIITQTPASTIVFTVFESKRFDVKEYVEESVTEQLKKNPHNARVLLYSNNHYAPLDKTFLLKSCHGSLSIKKVFNDFTIREQFDQLKKLNQDTYNPDFNIIKARILTAILEKILINIWNIDEIKYLLEESQTLSDPTLRMKIKTQITNKRLTINLKNLEMRRNLSWDLRQCQGFIAELPKEIKVKVRDKIRSLKQ